MNGSSSASDCPMNDPLSKEGYSSMVKDEQGNDREDAAILGEAERDKQDKKKNKVL